MQFTTDNLATVVDALQDAILHCRTEIGLNMGSDNYEYIDACEEQILIYQRMQARIYKRHPHLKPSEGG